MKYKLEINKDFPSLVGKNTNDVETDCMTETIFHYKDIEKYTVDKKLVLMAINHITEAVDSATFKSGASKIYANIAYVKEKLFLNVKQEGGDGVNSSHQ